jgi:hypothetical protein
MESEKPIWSNLEQYLDSLEDGTELSLVLWTSGHAQVNFIKQHPKKYAKTVFASYTTPRGFRGAVPLFRFKVKKESKKKRLSFPFELESFEINAALIKAKFRRK